MKIVKILGALIAVVLLAAGGAYAWSQSTANAKLTQVIDVQPKDVPVPWPISDDAVAKMKAELRTEAEEAMAADVREKAAAEGITDEAEVQQRVQEATQGIDVDALFAEKYPGGVEKLAMVAGIERGKHLVEARAGCQHCHGEDFGGQVIMENGAMGRWAAPNITQGTGSVTKGYTSANWVGILRHGVRRDHTAASMPSLDYANLSDQELSDIIAFVQSQPPVDRENPPIVIGPVLGFLIALEEFPISAELIDHNAARPGDAPVSEVTPEYGKHLATACQGCHGPEFSGGKIPGADPKWPPAANLTPDATGLKGWKKDDFYRAIREGKRPDGRELDKVAMPWTMLRNMTDTEIDALWEFFQAIPAKAHGGR